MNIRLYNAKILTMEKHRPIFRGEIWVKNDKIACVVDLDSIDSALLKELPRIDWDLQLDCRENLLMPGFKDAHTHSAMTFLRSLADDVPLAGWLEDIVFPAESKLNSDDIYEFTRLAVLEYLASGITSIFDMYIQPDAVGEACLDMGMRCVLNSGLNNFTSSVEQTAEEYIRWNKRSSLISYQLGFHAEYTCSKELLYQISRLAHEFRAPVYMHLAETRREVEECKARNGMTPAMFLEAMGIFDFGGGGFHCVHMSKEDMEVFHRRRLHVITNPASNLKLASGIAPVAEFDRMKIPVAIGTDGAASNNCLDMFREMYLTAALAKVKYEDAAALDAERVLRMATVHGAKAMRLPKADVLAKGKLADIILIDLHTPNMKPTNHIIKNLVYSGNNRNIKMTMIGGKILYQDGTYFVGESPERIYESCEARLNRLIKA